MYLATVPSEDLCKCGLTVIIHMPILRALQEACPAQIHVALNRKPDNFWQKKKTNFGSSKFIFEMSMVYVVDLGKLVGPSQLTEKLDVSLHYNQRSGLSCVSLEGVLQQCTCSDAMRTCRRCWPGRSSL